MAAETVTSSLPAPLYEQLKHRGEQSRRSIEEETLEVLAVAVPAESTLPTGLTQEIEPLRQLGDQELRQAATQRLSEDVASQLEQLHTK